MPGRRCEEEGRSAGEDLRGVRPAVRLAQEMGALLGRGALLLGTLPARADWRTDVVGARLPAILTAQAHRQQAGSCRPVPAERRLC